MTTITTRASKGSPLTYEELDANFNNLNTDKLETTGGTLTGSVTFSEAATGVVFSDATTLTTTADVTTVARDAVSLVTDDATSLSYNNVTGVFTYNVPTGGGGGGTADAASTVVITVRNETGSTIPANTAVYISGAQGNNTLVAPADANAAGHYPAVGLLLTSLANNTTGDMVSFGEITGFDTTGYAANEVLYLSETPGQLTNVRPPAETTAVQGVARVIRADVSNGIIVVMGAGRSNDIPNLSENHVFVGTPSNGYEKRQLTTDDLTEGTNLFYTDARAEAVSINNLVEDTTPELGGTLNVQNNTIINGGIIAVGQGSSSNIPVSGIEINAGSTSNNAYYCSTGVFRHFGTGFYSSGSFYNSYAAMGLITHSRTSDRLFATGSTMSGGTLDEWNTLNRITIDGQHMGSYVLDLNNNKSIRFYQRNTGVYTAFTQTTSGSPGNAIASQGALREYNFYFTQDATGGRTVAWQTWTGSAATNISNLIEFGTQDTSPGAVNYAQVRIKLDGFSTVPAAIYVHWENA